MELFKIISMAGIAICVVFVLGLWVEYRYFVWEQVSRAAAELARWLARTVVNAVVGAVALLLVAVALGLFVGAAWAIIQMGIWAYDNLMYIVGFFLVIAVVYILYRFLHWALGGVEGKWRLFLALLFLAFTLMLFAALLATGALMYLLWLTGLALFLYALSLVGGLSAIAAWLLTLLAAAAVALSQCTGDEAIPVKVKLPVAALPAPEQPTPATVEWVRIGFAEANQGDGCIRLLKRLGVSETEFGTSYLGWCINEVGRLGRQMNWHHDPRRWEVPRVCLLVEGGGAERWTLWRHGEDLVVEVPPDARACTPKRLRKE